MKKIIALSLALFVQSFVSVLVYAAAITTAANGPWSTPGTWTGGVVPVSGDTVTINHAVTVTSNVTVGHSPPSGDAVRAIAISSGASLTVNTGFQLKVRGDLLLSGSNTVRSLVLQAGSILEMDASLATTPLSQIYRIITTSQYPGTQPSFQTLGTSGSRVTIRSNSAGGNARIVGSVNYYGLIDAQYTDFTRIGGSGTSYAIEFSAPSDGSDAFASVFRLSNCTFNNSGDVHAPAASVGPYAKITIQNVSFKSSQGSYGLRAGFYDAKAGAGVRIISNNVFDKRPQILSPRDVTMQGNFYNLGWTFSSTDNVGTALHDGSFIRAVTANQEFVPNGDLTNFFFLFDDAAATNPHFLQGAGFNYLSTSKIEGGIFEFTGTDGNGDAIIVGSPSNAQTLVMKQNIILPNAAGENSGTLFSALGNANVSISAENNTYISGTQGAAVGETYTGRTGFLTTFLNNLQWDTSARGYKLFDSGTNDSISNLVTSANANYNGGFNYLTGSNLKGYHNLEFSAGSPGANDVNADPQFVDNTRDLAKWDLSLGGPGTTANALTELRKMNDATGYNSAYNIAALLAYIRGGFAPQNAAYDNTGSGGVDIGAVTVIAATPTPIATPTATATATPAGTPALRIWANDGQDKVTQDELRASVAPTAVYNDAWDGTTIKAWGARNEILGFATIIEAPGSSVANATFAMSALSCPGSTTISSASASPTDPFNYVNRPIAPYFTRYLQIKGIDDQNFSYQSDYCEAQVPTKLRRTGYSGCPGTTALGWADRPNAGKFYPEILVPLQAQIAKFGNFTVAGSSNQMIWTDVYIPKSIPAGVCNGTITVTGTGVTTQVIPFQLTVRNFTLPDSPSLKTMVYLGYSTINERYLGFNYPGTNPEIASVTPIRQNHYKVLHRNKLSGIETGENNLYYNGSAYVAAYNQPPDDVRTALDGTLFTSANGYDGPGVNTSNGVYSIGTYGTVWLGAPEFSGGVTQSAVNTYMNGWENYMASNFPNAERFLYLADEPPVAPPAGTPMPTPPPYEYQSQLNTVASLINLNPGTGNLIRTYMTEGLDDWEDNSPEVDNPSAWRATMPAIWATPAAAILANPAKRLGMYNGKRPATGSFATEDEGTSPRVVAWTQYKKRVHRWHYWDATYYVNNQFDGAKYNLFTQAKTIGTTLNTSDPIYGESGDRYTNGDGVLFYPGTDTLHPADSYGLNGPVESLRMKLWRRGIQDGDYLTMAEAYNPAGVTSLVNAMVPSVLWENGETGAGYLHAGPSWSTTPSTWESARSSLATMIETGSGGGVGDRLRCCLGLLGVGN